MKFKCSRASTCTENRPCTEAYLGPVKDNSGFEGWFVDFPNIETLVQFVSKHGAVIISEDGAEGTTLVQFASKHGAAIISEDGAEGTTPSISILIYDDYVE